MVRDSSAARDASAGQSRELAGLVAVVTGSSRGVGRQIALELASAGAAVLVHGGHDAQATATVADELRDAGVGAESLVLDLSEPTKQDELVDEAITWRGHVDIWVNNAGADVLTGAAAHWSFDRKLEALLKLDVTATLRMARRVGRRMQDRGRGTILNVGWEGAGRGMAGDSGELFAAAKGAIMALTKSLALSLAPTVRVNAVAPGWIRTAWGEQASDYWQQRAEGESLLGRWGTPDDVAKVARFLVSPAAAFITGQVLAVSGGYRPG